LSQRRINFNRPCGIKIAIATKIDPTGISKALRKRGTTQQKKGWNSKVGDDARIVCDILARQQGGRG
jgi:hypothetical protein